VTFYNLLLLFISGSIASSFFVFIIKIKAKDDSSFLLLFNKDISCLGRLLLTFIPIFV
jgi:ABC-type multidrug transport system permease subunit